MIPVDLTLIKNLELTTRKLISGPLLGDARSHLKGSGFEFHQLREYEQGDDIRFVDWKSSARSNKMLVRQYLEDRNRTVYIAVDISASTHFGSYTFGTGTVAKIDLMKQLAAILAFVSLHKKDAVGLILFSTENEIVIPPRSSRAHVYALVKTLFSHKTRNKGTSLQAPLDYLARRTGQKALVCFISDFLGSWDQNMLKLAAHRHDMLAFRCLDARELHFPDVGMLRMEESETDAAYEVNGEGIQDALAHWHRQQKEQLSAAKIDCLDLIAGAAFAGDLVRFLRTRLYG